MTKKKKRVKQSTKRFFYSLIILALEKMQDKTTQDNIRQDAKKIRNSKQKEKEKKRYDTRFVFLVHLD